MPPQQQLHAHCTCIRVHVSPNSRRTCPQDLVRFSRFNQSSLEIAYTSIRTRPGYAPPPSPRSLMSRRGGRRSAARSVSKYVDSGESLSNIQHSEILPNYGHEQGDNGQLSIAVSALRRSSFSTHAFVEASSWQQDMWGMLGGPNGEPDESRGRWATRGLVCLGPHTARD